jgi:predicted AAA+ superfamily ATPase
MLDTGLLCALGFIGIQSALLMGDIGINEGGITENSIAAALAKKNIPLYYYDKKSRLELDFVFVDNGGLSVVEVKSGKDYKRHASLDHAYKDVQGKLNRRIVLSRYNVEKNTDGIIYYPFIW